VDEERTGTTGRRLLYWVLLVGGVVLVLETLSGLYRGWYVDRIGGYGFPRDLFVPDRELGFGLKPGFVGHFTREYSGVEIRINADGFRDGPFGEPGEGPRVAFVGDSVVFGAGVDAAACMDARLEEELATRLGRGGATVLNLGIYAYSLDQYVTMLRRELPVLRPDLVLVGFCVNDIEDGASAAWPAGVARGGARLALKRVSNVAWLAAHLRQRIFLPASRAHFRNTEEDWRSYCRDVVSRWSTPAGAARLARNLDGLAAIASGPGAPPLLAILWPTSYELEEPEGDWGRPRALLRRALADRGIPWLDPHDALAAAAPPRELFLEGDRMHFSPAGHRLVAELLADEVVARLGGAPASRLEAAKSLQKERPD
jgi:lysophospholipase L1-like esterase